MKWFIVSNHIKDEISDTLKYKYQTDPLQTIQNFGL